METRLSRKARVFRGAFMDEIIRRFNEAGIRYLVIGGQAARLHGVPRFSMDWDIYIPAADEENLRRINELLKEELDVPLTGLGPLGENFIQTYQTSAGILQFHLGGAGLPPFEEAERRAEFRTTENGVPVRCLGGADLLASKEAAGRPEDQIDIEFLRAKKAAGRL